MSLIDQREILSAIVADMEADPATTAEGIRSQIGTIEGQIERLNADLRAKRVSDEEYRDELRSLVSDKALLTGLLRKADSLARFGPPPQPRPRTPEGTYADDGR